MYKSLILLLAVVVFFSCKDVEKTAEETASKTPTQMERVIAVHDALMPKMNDIATLSAALEMRNDSVAKASLADLKMAHHTMMQWMQDFGADFKREEIQGTLELTPDKQTLLQNHENRVIALEQIMLQAIDKAKTLTNK